MARTRNDAEFEQKQRAILAAAEALFAAHGFHQTGMAAICAAAGLSPGALYRYYPSKSAIIAAIVEAEQADAVVRIEALADAPDLRGALVETLAEAIETMSKDDYAPLALEIAAEGARDEAIGATLAQAVQRVESGIARIIRTAQKRGEVAASVDAAAAAALLLMLIDGATGRSRASLAPRGAKLKAALARLVAGLLPAADGR